MGTPAAMRPVASAASVEAMPAGTYDFYFRLRASVEGEFSHPSARAEMMYEMGTYGTSPGAKIVVQAAR